MDCSSLSDGLKPCFLNTWTINTVTVGRRIFHTNCTFPSSSVVISSVRSTSNNAKASLRQSRSWVVIWRSRLRQGSQDCLDLALDLLLILSNKYVWTCEQFCSANKNNFQLSWFVCVCRVPVTVILSDTVTGMFVVCYCSGGGGRQQGEDEAACWMLPLPGVTPGFPGQAWPRQTTQSGQQSRSFHGTAVQSSPLSPLFMVYRSSLLGVNINKNVIFLFLEINLYNSRLGSTGFKG